MKKILMAVVSAAAWLGMSGLASAQTFNWTGFYIGANAGWLSNDFNGTFPLAPGFLFNPGRADQAIGGFYGGYQFQNGNWVIGVETGFDLPLGNNYASGSGSGLAGTDCAYGGTALCEARLDKIFRAGARLGWAFDRWLVYGTGGYARAQIQARENVPGSGISDQADSYGDGWYGGGGVDFAVLTNLFLGIEYRHYDFGTVRVGSAAGGSGNPTLRDISATADSVMGRLTIKMGP